MHAESLRPCATLRLLRYKNQLLPGTQTPVLKLITQMSMKNMSYAIRKN